MSRQALKMHQKAKPEDGSTSWISATRVAFFKVTFLFVLLCFRVFLLQSGLKNLREHALMELMVVSVDV